MSVNFALWRGSLDATRAADAWQRIAEKPTSVAFVPPTGATLSAQTVRLEWDSTASESESEAGRGPVRKLIIFGVKDHASLDDTDMETGYRFVYQDQEYRVIDVIDSIGERQGHAEVTN